MSLRIAKRLNFVCQKFAQIPKPLHVWKWAEEKRTLPSEVTAKSGPYRIKTTPAMQEPQEGFFSPEVQVTVLCMASRLGKTEGEMNLTGYTIDHDQCHILWVYPTLDSAKKWRKEFFNPMIENSKCFNGKIRPPRSRDGDNTMFSVGFPGGRVAVIGANSPSAFRQIQAPRVICEEVDAMENTKEGDPILLAFKRADNYRESVQVISSSPTIKGKSRVWDWLEKSDFRKWNVKCKACAHEFVLMWADMKWDEGQPQTARIVCPGCGEAHGDEDRRAMVAAGRWIATKPFTGIRGYWLNGLNSLMPSKRGFRNRMHQFVAEFLQAKDGGAEAVQTWTNTFLAECYEEPNTSISAEGVRDHAEAYDPLEMLPRPVLLLTASADIQKDRIEVSVDGWGEDEECWSVQVKVLYGDTRKDQVWKDLDKVLLEAFEHPSGMKLPITRALIDMGYAQDRVLAFTGPRASRGVFACKGINKVGTGVPPLVPSKPSRNNRARVPFWPVGVTVAKHAIYSRLVMLPGGARTIHFPSPVKNGDKEEDFGFSIDYFKQLTSEKMKTRYSFGKPYYIFETDHKGVRNEAIDLRVYSFAALHSLGRVLWHKLKENVDEYEKSHPKKEVPDAGDGEAATGNLHREGNIPEGTERIRDEHISPETPPASPVLPQQPARPFVPRRPRPGGWTKGWR